MTGYQALTDRIVIAKKYTIFLGGIPGIIIYDFWDKKLRPTFGTTYAGGTGGPPVFLGEMLFHYISLTEAFNQVVDKTPGWNWWIDDYNSLQYQNTLAKSPDAPFSIVDSPSILDKITVVQTGRKKRNKQWVVPRLDLNGLLEESHVGDGTNTSFPTDYTQLSTPLIMVDGVEQSVTELGTWPAGWQWYFVPGGIGVFARVAPTVGAVIDVRYPLPFPIGFSRSNSTDIITNGLWESALHSKSITTQVDAEATAQGLVDLYTDPGGDEYPSIIRYEYNSEHEMEWLTPGMVVSVNRTFPDVAGNFIVESVASAEQQLTVFRHQVVLRNQAGDVDESRFIDDLLVASRAQISSKVIPATLELDINGFGLEVTAPGSFLPNRFVVQNDGVIADWDTLNEVSPPVGADIIIDCFLNGTSIFLATDTRKMYFPDGSTAKTVGNLFTDANIPVKKGDVISFKVLQVGSVQPGRYGVGHINMKV